MNWTMLMKTARCLNPLIFWKHKCLWQKLTMLVNVDLFQASKQVEGINVHLSADGPTCSSGIWKATYLSCDSNHNDAVCSIAVGIFEWCRLVLEEKQMTRLGLESGRGLYLWTVCWYTYLRLTVMRTSL